MDLICICLMANDVKHLFLCLFVYLCLWMYLFKHLGGKVFNCSLMSILYRLCSHVTSFQRRNSVEICTPWTRKRSRDVILSWMLFLAQRGKKNSVSCVSVTQYNNNTDYCFIPPGRPSSFASYDVGSFVTILKTLLSLAEAWWLGLGSRR